LSQFTALFDACVLYPAPLRDLLMELALTDLFRAKWTNEIHDEWIQNLLKNRPDLTLERLQITRDKMNLHIQDSLVENYQSLIPLLALSDQDDRHVLAAAICARADVIITFNLSDFPPESLEIYGIEAQHPDEFISHLIDLAPPLVYKAIQEIRTRLKNPPRTINELLKTYEDLGLIKTVAALRFYQDLL
jgi:predicted nucleic acid-binding protein